MAAGPTALVSVGDFVSTDNRVCYVENIEKNLGFNQYILVDIDSGVQLRKCRYQIQPIQVEFVTGDETDVEFENINIEPLESNEDQKKGKDEEKRFPTLSEQDLNTLQMNTNSKNTKSQTHWGVKIFKGERRCHVYKQKFKPPAPVNICQTDLIRSSEIFPTNLVTFQHLHIYIESIKGK
jgi:hypothetical protein